MICPRCSNSTEMAFSVMAQAFICQEEDCGLEIEMDRMELEALPCPEDVLAVA